LPNGSEKSKKTDDPDGEEPAAVAAPVTSPSGGTYSTDQNVTLSCPTEGAVIRFTVDGTTPSRSSALYSAAIPVQGNGAQVTIKAFAARDGMADSPVSAATYVISNPAQVSLPVFSEPSGTYASAPHIGLSTATDGASIRYTTDGTDPSRTAGASYDGTPIAVSADGTEIKAIAFLDGYQDSAVASAVYRLKLPTPALDVAAGTVAAGTVVSFSCAEAGVSFRFTTDGTAPGSGSTSGSSCAINTSPVNLRVIAVKAGWQNSGAAAAVYTLRLPAPALTPSSGSLDPSTPIAFSCAESGVTYRYTTDGTDPTAASPSGASYAISKTPVAVRVVATKAGWANSPVSSGNFTINRPAAPSNLALSAKAEYHDSTHHYWEITLGWQDNSTYETGFAVEAQDNAGEWLPVSSGSYFGENVESAVVRGTVKGGLHTYFTTEQEIIPFRVKATHWAIDSVYSSEFDVPVGLFKPLDPFFASSSGSYFEIRWTDASANETGFHIERKTGSGGIYAAVGSVGANTTSFTDTSSARGVEYYYRVQTYTTTFATVSAYSDEVYAYVP
jgi:hypothetical protein